MKKYLVIGNPINHSLSPKLHSHWLKENNIDAVYDKKKLDEIKLDDTSRESFIEITDPYDVSGTTSGGQSEVHERIKTELQKQMFNSVNKMQTTTALHRLIELARIEYYQEHMEDDPTCSNFKIEEFLKIDSKDLNFQDLQGTPKPLFDHNSLEISKSGLGVYMDCPYKYKLEKIHNLLYGYTFTSYTKLIS